MSKMKLGGFSAGTGVDFEAFLSETLETILDYNYEAASKTQLRFWDNARNSMTFTGSGLTYKYVDGEVFGITAGKITGLTILSAGNTMWSATGLNISGTTLSAAFDSGSTVKFLNTLLSGADDLSGTNYADMFWGGNGNDILRGLNGADDLDGDNGNDQLFGGAGNDWLAGGNGVDKLDGGAGADVMRGQVGADIFIFKTGYGADRITDFDAVGSDHDRIDLSDVNSITSFADLKTNHLTVSGSNIIINAGNGDKIILEHVTLSTLDASDFIF